jgi:hypothetical protein
VGLDQKLKDETLSVVKKIDPSNTNPCVLLGYINMDLDGISSTLK